jgi:hypothetical protein
MGSLHANSYQKLSAERCGPTELTLNESGMILDCSDSAEYLLEYVRIQLIGQPVSRLLPKLSAITLLEDGKLKATLIKATEFTPEALFLTT